MNCYSISTAIKFQYTNENCFDCLQDTRTSPGDQLSNSRTMHPRGKPFLLERHRLFCSTSFVYSGTFPSHLHNASSLAHVGSPYGPRDRGYR